MRIHSLRFLSMLTLSASLSLIGCADDPASTGGTPAADPHAHEEHAHPSEGPHHGSLIELGQEQYHAELVHDEATGSVTIYLLDHQAKQAVPIEATEIMINASHEGTAEQFPLAAQPDEGDPAGKSSRFVSTGKALGEHLHEEGAEARLVVKIDGQSFHGEIAHEHDHAHDHDHDHGHGHAHE